MSTRKSKDVIDLFWSLIQQRKYKAALRTFLSEKNNIFHNITTLRNTIKLLKNDSQNKYQQYFILFLLNVGLKDFMTDARNSRRWKDDKYHQNVMEMYNVLSYLLNNSQTVTETYSIGNKQTNIFQLLIKTIESKSILGYPYFHKHLNLFWNYFMISSNLRFTINEKRIHTEKLRRLIYFGFDVAIENIYLSMHNPKNNDMNCVHRYRGFILKILCTLYYFCSDNVQLHYKLDNKQNIMEYIIKDYFVLNVNHCNNYYLYSTETIIAKFIAHSYNFGYFMGKIIALSDNTLGMLSDMDDTMQKKRSLINATTMYRILLPFDIILKSSHSKQKMEYYINTLLHNLQHKWKQNDENKIVENRFLYLVNNDGNIDGKLGRYTCCNSNNYGYFQILSCHLIDILLKNYIISFYKFTQKYLLQRTNNNEIKNLLLSMSDALKYEESATVSTDNSDGCVKQSDTVNIQYAISKLCNEKHNNGINVKEYKELKEEIIQLNMSFIGAIPMNVLNDIINYYQRTFLVSYYNCYPIDVHNLILLYCDMFKSNEIINTIKYGQIVLVETMQYVPVDVEYVFNGKWMICRVMDIIYGPMGNVIQLLILYRIGLNHYGYLWVNIKYIKWINEFNFWKYNVILNKNIKQNKLLQCMFRTDIEIGLFQSWWDMFVKKWIEEETVYNNLQKMALKQQKTFQSSFTKTPYLTVHTKRQYKSQKRRPKKSKYKSRR